MAGSGRGRRKHAGKLKARQAALKDSNADQTDSSHELSEELTALAAIFQDDFRLISEKPFLEVGVNMRPHYVNDGDDDDFVAAELLVRFLPGYPQRPPKLQIVAKRGVNSEQLRYLHAMLADQAASIAREGRVMIFTLAEAAQEFLSEQCRGDEFAEEQPSHLESGASTLVPTDEDWHIAQGTPSASDDVEPDPGFDDTIYLDLFDKLWGEAEVHLDESQIATGSVQPNSAPRSTVPFRGQPFWENDRGPEPSERNVMEAKNATGAPRWNGSNGLAPVKHPTQLNLLTVPEDELHALSSTGHSTLASDFLERLHSGLVTEHGTEQSCGSTFGAFGEAHDQMPSSAESCAVSVQGSLATQSIQKDLVMGYLLRLACSPRGPLTRELPLLSSELQEMGILSQWAKDLLASQPQLFDAVFRKTFVNLSQETQTPGFAQPSASKGAESFWNANPELLGEGSDTSSSTSRYLNDFEEIVLLGRGGFGHVVLCKNKLDGRRYAMKKIRLKDNSLVSNDKILREVATLARLQHHHVVRYYQAWIETGVRHLQQQVVNGDSEDSGGSEFHRLQERSTSGIPSQYSTSTDFAWKNSAPATYLYIQMEYCPRTLREVFESNSGPVNKDEIWRMFRQLVQGLAHIHGQGILHRDLTPNNIFFDSHGDIKIGDFGLAKFTNLEQQDKDPKLADTREIPNPFIEGTSDVGTYFYTAPEMDQGLPNIDVKVDIYSLGVVFFEFWHPFTTAMERHVVLSDVKQRGVLPAIWSSECPQQDTLVRWLIAPNPVDRPSAAQILRSDLLPPRMENESLNDILRTIQKAQDTSVYDQVVAAIFDFERIAAKASYVDADLAKLKRSEKDKSLIQMVSDRNPLLESVKEVFLRHGARAVESSCFSVVDDLHDMNRHVANLLDLSGNMLDVRFEPRLLLARWLAVNQKTSFKSYELSRVYRRSIGDTAPRECFQGDFDIIGGTRTLAEAEVVKVAVEIVDKFPVFDSCHVRINHRQILRAIWNWTGLQGQDVQKVAQVLGVLGTASPQSSARKALWPIVRRQLLQGLHLQEGIVDRLQTVERRLSGNADEVLPRLRGALPPSGSTLAAIDELLALLKYLRVWHIEEVVLDALMTATDDFFNGTFFQVHAGKTSSFHRNSSPPACIAVGGSYDPLIAKYWRNYSASSSPGAVGVSIAVQRLIDATIVERMKSIGAAEVLVCSKGGGGLLAERMEVVNDLWSANIKADYMCSEAPSLTQQYEYAHDNGIKWLVIITDAALSLAGTVKVRRLDLKAEEDIPKVELVKYFTDIATAPLNLRKKASNIRLSG